jgi:hypothetical protein
MIDTESKSTIFLPIRIGVSVRLIDFIIWREVIDPHKVARDLNSITWSVCCREESTVAFSASHS